MNELEECWEMIAEEPTEQRNVDGWSRGYVENPYIELMTAIINQAVEDLRNLIKHGVIKPDGSVCHKTLNRVKVEQRRLLLSGYNSTKEVCDLIKYFKNDCGGYLSSVGIDVTGKQILKNEGVAL